MAGSIRWHGRTTRRLDAAATVLETQEGGRAAGLGGGFPTRALPTVASTSPRSTAYASTSTSDLASPTSSLMAPRGLSRTERRGCHRIGWRCWRMRRRMGGGPAHELRNSVPARWSR
ncbi:unnamed protein product [Urochloa humidicola]